jgi:hypothetical protein
VTLQLHEMAVFIVVVVGVFRREFGICIFDRFGKFVEDSESEIELNLSTVQRVVDGF